MLYLRIEVEKITATHFPIGHCPSIYILLIPVELAPAITGHLLCQLELLPEGVQ